MRTNQSPNDKQFSLDQWTIMLKRLQVYQQENNGSSDVPCIYPPDLQLGNWVMTQRGTYKKGLLPKERYDQLEAISFDWRSTNREQSFQNQWTKMFKRLQVYQLEHSGNCNVPRSYRQDPQLASWVHRQRKKYKKGLLTKERCDQLEAIGFEYSKIRELNGQDKWTKMLTRLQAYQQKHNGICNVSSRDHQDGELGRWVAKQRWSYRQGLLTKERRDQLEAIGFEWTTNVEQSWQDQWTGMLKRLQAYQQEHNGICNVSSKYSQDPQLANWVHRQRQTYKKGLLAKDRCDQLEAIGFEWAGRREKNSPLPSRWLQMLERLQAYQQEHGGSCNVPNRYRHDPQLGSWVSLQRHEYKKGLLRKERYDQLEAIGFEWTPKDHGWNEMLKRLQAYQKDHNGSCNVPARYPQDPKLGTWVVKQRSSYKKSLIAKERCDQLEAIGFQWTPKRTLASTQLQPRLSEVSQTKQLGIQGLRRWCMV